MLFNFVALWAFSLLIHNLGTVQAQGVLKGEDEDVNGIFVPVFDVPAEESEEDADDIQTSGPLSFKKIYNKGLPILTPLKSLLSWKENQTSFLGSVLQIKVAIEMMHEKHESLLNHIKCVFPVPPKNCTALQTHSSKWNWTSLIPTGFKPQSFFQPESELHIGPIAAVFISAIEHLENKQNKIYEFVSCACQKNSNCTVKPSWHLFNGTYWHNKIHNLNPLNWQIFNISKPHKPSSGYFMGTLVHKPILAYFNHTSSSGNGPSGFVVAVTGGHVPSFPTGVYGNTPEQQSGQEQSEIGGGQSSGGGFGGYINAALPTYTGTVIIGNFPQNTGSGNSPPFVSGSVHGVLHTTGQSNYTSSHAQEVTSTVNQTSSGSSHSQGNITFSGNVSGVATGGKPIVNSIAIPKCPGFKTCENATVTDIKPDNKNISINHAVPIVSLF